MLFTYNFNILDSLIIKKFAAWKLAALFFKEKNILIASWSFDQKRLICRFNNYILTIIFDMSRKA
jgi:hypothetical protein